MIKDQMDRIYGETPLEKIPWNVATPPPVLRTAIEAVMAPGDSAIELGCGAGNYVIHFARMGYAMTGVDISAKAIAIANESAARAGATCRFVAADVLGELDEIKGRFDAAYDWELLHHIFPEDRERYVRNVHRLLNDRGWYLSVCFSEDDPQFGGRGKYRTTSLETVLYFSSEQELESLFKKHFAIHELKTIDVQGRFAAHRAVYALMRKGGG